MAYLRIFSFILLNLTQGRFEWIGKIFIILNIFFLIALTKITAVIWWIKNLVRKLEIFNLPFEFFTIFV